MAVLIQNSDLVQAYVDKKRLRTQNYRGSILNTVVEDTNAWGSSDNGSYLYLTLVPYSAALKSLKVGFGSDRNQLAYTLGIAGINTDSSFTDIKVDLVTVAAAGADVAAGTFSELVTPSLWGKTIYQQLCDANGNPIEAFEKYSKNRYGVLFLKSTAKNTGAIANTYVNLEWVEGTPSEAPLISKTFSK